MTDEAYPPIHFRAGRPDDVPALAELAALCTDPERRYPATLLEYMARQPSCRIIVAQNHVVIGFVVAHKLRGPSGEIVTIDVAPAYRHRDVATALMEQGEAWLARNGAADVFLEVDCGNEPARALYQKQGYSVVEEFEEDGIRRFLMQKRLGAAAEPTGIPAPSLA